MQFLQRYSTMLQKPKAGFTKQVYFLSETLFSLLINVLTTLA
jgi:hypothetical protein